MPIPDVPQANGKAKFIPIKWSWTCTVCDTENKEDEDIADMEVVSCSRCDTGHFVERNEKEWG
jgi:hypothetical protein